MAPLFPNARMDSRKETLMYLRNLIIVAAVMSACQFNLLATPGDPIQGIDVTAGKKPKSHNNIVARTDSNGRVHFILDAGTYEISIREPGGIPGVPVGSAVQLSGKALKQPVAANIGAPVSVPLATGSIVLNPNPIQSQLL